MVLMTEKKVVPKLRFAEFNDYWQQKTLGDLGGLINGLTYSPKDIADDGVLVLRSSNVQNNQLVFEDNVYVNVESYNPVKENDILICVRNGSKRLIGKNCLIDKNNEGVAFGAFMTVYRSINNKFIFHLFSLSSYYKTIHQNLGATINSINNNDLKKFKFFFPSPPEQQKIASFLSAVDEKLQQLTKKKELLKAYRKGVMQKIFSQELRFKNEFGNNYPDWKEKKLGEELEHKSIRNKSNQVDLVLSVSNKKGFISQQEQFDGHQVASKDVTNYKVVNKGDYAYNPSRINVGSIARLDDFEKGIVSPMYVIFRLKNNLNPIFFDALLSSHRFKYLIKIGCSGSVRDSLNFDEMENFDVILPCIEEQKKIADFLSSLDSKIDLVSNQIEKTEAFKKGLLQQMFV